MVIDPNNINNASSTSAKGRTLNNDQATPKLTPEKTIQSPGENVQLSPEAQGFAKLESAIQASPDTDTVRIQQVKHAIHSGQYQIDANAIAGKILGDENV